MTAIATERVKVEVADHVATVTLTRPDKHNALDQAMFDGISAAAREVGSTSGVRAVVLCGEGPSFCSGLDLMGMMSTGKGLDVITEPLRGPFPNPFQDVAYAWIAEVPVPVICAIHGNCFGGGLQIALGADIRICTPDAKLSIMEMRWGLIPDMSITRTLPRLVGIDVAKELTYTGRVFSGSDALSLGVVTRVADDPLAAALQLAGEIAGKSPDAVRGAKKLFDSAWTGPAEVTLRLEADLQGSLIGSPNQLEAVRAGFAKEAPSFADPS
jgi:enoyl-CoA hydratase/carnithine racemase